MSGVLDLKEKPKNVTILFLKMLMYFQKTGFLEISAAFLMGGVHNACCVCRRPLIIQCAWRRLLDVASLLFHSWLEGPVVQPGPIVLGHGPMT